eukprot:Ihof_evm18s49 gene=Ihof_evmTU18s49
MSQPTEEALRRAWVDALSGVLLFDASDLVLHLLSLDTAAELSNELESLLDMRQDSHQTLARKMMREAFPGSLWGGEMGGEIKAYRKTDGEDDVFFAGSLNKKGKQRKHQQQQQQQQALQKQQEEAYRVSMRNTPRWQAPVQSPDPGLLRQRSRPQQTQNSSLPLNQRPERTPKGKSESLKQTAKSTNMKMNTGVMYLPKDMTETNAPKPQRMEDSGTKGKHKKKHLVKFNAEELERTPLSGRHMCDCQAQTHRLVGNCLECGRIVCEQEGAGPCMYCGKMSIGDTTVGLGSKTAVKKERQRLKEEAGGVNGLVMTTQEVDPGLERALAAKDRLLQFDLQNVQRTKVIDDENDYFEVDNRWLSQKERLERKHAERAMLEAKQKAKKSFVVTLDFTGKTVIEEDAAKDIEASTFLPESKKESSVVVSAKAIGPTVGMYHNPDLKDAPKYIPSKPPVKGMPTKSAFTDKELRPVYRVQDTELTLMGDAGMCLSMHQPWASLLVAGLKTVEGRVWYTPHRGRLWIAAAAHVPSVEEIAAVEQQYKLLYKDPNMTFPDYPTGCLLGAVDVVDCLAREDYLEKFQDKAAEESNSPYVFVCERPEMLPVKFSISGDHKI